MRNMLLCFALFTFTIVVAGCGSSMDQQENAVSAHEDPKKELLRAKAIYIGLIDSNSIEVVIDKSPTAIQISKVQYKTLESLQTNTPISITYYVKKSTSQNILENVVIIDD